jgi:pimeloyl-ACP methyl ester carboxylesterase
MARETKFTSTAFGEIAYTEQGAGPVALFVHGVLLNGYLWRHVIDRVKDLRRCIAVDLMAHGATKISRDQDVSFTAQAEMLAAFCDSLKLDQVDLVANDSGGGIAQIFAARHPERIRSLTLTNCDTHDNWPPKAGEALFNAAAQGRLGGSAARCWRTRPSPAPHLLRPTNIPKRSRPKPSRSIWRRCSAIRRQRVTWSAGLSSPTTASRRLRSKPSCVGSKRLP